MLEHSHKKKKKEEKKEKLKFNNQPRYLCPQLKSLFVAPMFNSKNLCVEALSNSESQIDADHFLHQHIQHG